LRENVEIAILIISIMHGHKDNFIKKKYNFFIKYFKINLYGTRASQRTSTSYSI